MSTYQKRKLVTLGDTFFVSIPINWIRYQQLKKGDYISVYTKDDLIICCKEDSEAKAESLASSRTQ